MKLWKLMSVAVVVAVSAGCSTQGRFVIPEGSELYVYDRPQPVDIGANGRVVTKPFFWTAAGVPPHAGIPYRLEQDGKVIDEGGLRAKFRVASIFWPPFAAIYWPMGFNPDITYNLVDGTQQ